MTKNEFKDKVGMGFFSCEWIKKNGRVGKIKRGMLGAYAWRHTNNPIPTISAKELKIARKIKMPT